MRFADARNCPGFFLLMKKRVIFYVDGFNLYHSLLDASSKSRFGAKLKWLDIHKLMTSFLSRNEQLIQIKYFSAIFEANPQKANRHRRYIKVLKDKKIKVILGKFKHKDLYCKRCHRNYRSTEEKRTDVNIALHILQDAYKNRYDTIILVSGDTDLIPAIKMLKADFPTKKIGVIFPYGRKNLELANQVHFNKKIKIIDMEIAILPDAYNLRDGKVLTLPEEWK